MRSLGVVCLLALLSAQGTSPLTPTLAASETPTLALVGGRIYPAPDVLPIFDGTVVAADGKIVAVGKREDVEVPTGAVTLDCAGLVIAAGFQNSHVHFTEEKWADAAHLPAARLGEQLAAMLLRWGYTTVVDTASFLDNTAALRRRIDSGELAGPRILTAGAPLYPPHGIPFYVRERLPADMLPLLPQPATPEEARAAVERNVGGGADVAKLFTGSWVERGRVVPMPAEIAAAAVKTAHEHGQLVFSHPSNVAGLEIATEAGVDVLAHAIDDTRGLLPAHLERMRRHDMALVPTLALFGRDRWLFEIEGFVRDYARAGGQILFGTDVGYLTEYDPTDELVLLAAAGLSWREVLAVLTTAPAARFGESARRGRVAVGMDADLVVLGGDPVRDPRAFADVRYTLRGGRVVFAAKR